MRKYVVLFLFVFFVGLREANAQPCDCGDGTFNIACCPPDDPGPPVPIGAIEFIVGVGMLLGAKGLYDARKKKIKASQDSGG
jgi:hypothetical protein